MKLSPVRRPYCERIDSVCQPEEGRKSGYRFAYLQTGQETVNLNAASLQTQEREAVEVSLPISMHTGQIIILTKMITSSDLRFYGFENGEPVERWHSVPTSSS